MEGSIELSRGMIEALTALTSLKDARVVLNAIIAYGIDGVQVVDIPDHLQFGWNCIKGQIDRMKMEKKSK